MTRRKVQIKYGTEDGMRIMEIFDRPGVDDVFRQMVEQELYRVMTGVHEGDLVDRNFKDFLIRERYFVRHFAR